MSEAQSTIELLEKASFQVNSERAGIAVLDRALREEELSRLDALAAALSHIESAINKLKAEPSKIGDV